MEPKRRRDGRCVVCGKSIARTSTPVTRQLAKGGHDFYSRDPFCSTECCKAFNGTTPDDRAKKALTL